MVVHKHNIFLAIHKGTHFSGKGREELRIPCSQVLVHNAEAFLAAHAIWHKQLAIAKYGAQRKGNALNCQLTLIVFVAPKYFVSSVTGENDGDMFACQLRDIVGGQHGYIGEGLIVCPGQLWQDCNEVWPHKKFLMLGAKVPGYLAGIRKFTVIIFLETDRERLDRL